MCTLPAHHPQASPSKSGPRSPAPAAAAAAESAPASGSPSAEALNASTTEPATAAPEVARHYEISLLCLTNLGDCLVLSIPELKRQLNAAAVRREDIKYVLRGAFQSPIANDIMILF